MAPTTTEPPIGRVEEEEDDLIGDDSDDGSEAGEVRKRVSRLAVERADAGVNRARGREQGACKIGGGGGGVRSMREDEDAGVRGCRFSGPAGGRTLPPPHAWLAVEDTKKSYTSDPEEQWMRVLGGGEPHRPQRRSSFSVVRRERAAREAWLDQAWEMKKSWHERNGGAPDADTPVVVVVGKGPSSSSPSSQAAGSVGGGVAMDMEEMRACRDLGLELPSDCTVEIQCYGLSAGSSPTHSASGGGDSPSAGACSISSPGKNMLSRQTQHPLPCRARHGSTTMDGAQLDRSSL